MKIKLIAYRVFATNDHRLRLFFRLLIFAMVFAVILILRGPIQQFAGRLLHPSPNNLWGVVVVELVASTWAIAATILWARFCRKRIDRRPIAGLGLPAPWNRRGDIGLGIVFGATMLFAIFLVEISTGWLKIEGMKPGFTMWIAIGVMFEQFIHFVATAVCEEVAYRSYLLQNIGEILPVGIAALISGALFATSHFSSSGFGVGFVVAGTLASILLVAMRLATGSVWFGIGWHLGWDYLEVGLGIAPGFMPLKTTRQAVPLWTGSGMAVEGGLLFILALLAGLIAFLIVSRQYGQIINWRARLTPEGELVRN